MNYIEIDNSIIETTNISLINMVGRCLYVYLKQSDEIRGYKLFSYDTKEQTKTEYNRIKSILIGDNNENRN